VPESSKVTDPLPWDVTRTACTVLWLVVAHADDADGDGTRLQQLVEDGRHRLELEALAWFEGRRPLTGQ